MFPLKTENGTGAPIANTISVKTFFFQCCIALCEVIVTPSSLKYYEMFNSISAKNL